MISTRIDKRWIAANPCVRAILFIALLFAVACGGRQPPTDALTAAEDALSDADIERCAETEYNAARALLEQARAASDAGDYQEARELAEAAQIQAERARAAAEANPDCRDDDGEDEEVVAEVDPNANANSNADEDCCADYEWTAVRFDYNASTITPEGQETLAAHAEYLAEHTDLRLLVEGHCDARGSVEYNIALGERRARSVRAYLSQLGVEDSRMRAVSYGAMRPAREGDHDANRRAEFRATR